MQCLTCFIFGGIFGCRFCYLTCFYWYQHTGALMFSYSLMLRLTVFFFPSPMLLLWHFKLFFCFLFFFNILYSRLLMCLKLLFFDVMICDYVFHHWGESARRLCHTQTEEQCDAFAIFLSVPQLSFFSGFVSETITAGSILCFFPRYLQCDLSKSTFLNRNTLSELFIVLTLLVTSFKREKSVARCLSRDSSCLFWAYTSDSPGL